MILTSQFKNSSESLWKSSESLWKSLKVFESHWKPLKVSESLLMNLTFMHSKPVFSLVFLLSTLIFAKKITLVSRTNVQVQLNVLGGFLKFSTLNFSFTK